MHSFLSSNIFIYISIGIAAALLILLISKLLKQRKDKKHQKEMSMLQQRNEALNEALSNPKVKKSDATMTAPMEVHWDSQALNKPKTRKSSLMIELVEFSTYSRRKYLFSADQIIRIGSGADNQLVLPREGVCPKHCEIFLVDHAVAVRNVSGTNALLLRGKSSAFINEEGVFLNNGDHIKMGSADIQFRCFNA